MRITTGRVIEGKVVVEGEPLEEGAAVTVIADESESFVLVPEEKEELRAAIREADEGLLSDGFELLRDLGRKQR